MRFVERWNIILWWTIAVLLSESSRSQSLKLLTLNLWSGLDYHGVFSIGKYEAPEVRETRIRLVEKMLTQERPDILALQEVNPVSGLGSRLARMLDYDFIAQRVNSGLKIGPIGFPCNMNEGLVILARKDLHLEFYDVWDLSGSSGVIGNGLSLHWTEHDIALVGTISLSGVPVYVINVHTIAVVPVDSVYRGVLSDIVEREGLTGRDREKIFESYEERAQSIQKELIELSDRIKTLPSSRPVVLLGDFNVAAPQRVMQEFLSGSGLTDAAEAAGRNDLTTWDADHNDNTSFSRRGQDAEGVRESGLDLLSASYDGQTRRIDYILLNGAFSRKDVRDVRIVLDSPVGGLYASDHYGVLGEISTTGLLKTQQPENNSVPVLQESTIEPLPIISYDTDVGFGYGAKVFLLNTLGRSESFDAVLFNSTKGERWYRLVFSIPDFEIRQGKVYPFALDFLIDYDKYLKNSFFGVGGVSQFPDREYYTREPLELSATASRGISEHVVVQGGVRYKYVRNFSFSDSSRLRVSSPALNSGIARYHSLFATYRYDTRNSFINPSRGLVIQAEGEYAPQSGLTNVQLGRVGAWGQYYSTLFYPKSVLALRIGVQSLFGDNLPVQVLLPVGGNQTLRGSPQDRYLDKTSAIVNAEIRFPIWWRFGGVLGYDAGKVSSHISDLRLDHWATNPVLGLRFFMDTFVVRLDFGFGRETTGFYLNFGHLF